MSFYCSPNVRFGDSYFALKLSWFFCKIQNFIIVFWKVSGPNHYTVFASVKLRVNFVYIVKNSVSSAIHLKRLLKVRYAFFICYIWIWSCPIYLLDISNGRLLFCSLEMREFVFICFVRIVTCKLRGPVEPHVGGLVFLYIPLPSRLIHFILPQQA